MFALSRVHIAQQKRVVGRGVYGDDKLRVCTLRHGDIKLTGGIGCYCSERRQYLQVLGEQTGAGGQLQRAGTHESGIRQHILRQRFLHSNILYGRIHAFDDFLVAANRCQA